MSALPFLYAFPNAIKKIVYVIEIWI